jgi:hypothetical protein
VTEWPLSDPSACICHVSLNILAALRLCIDKLRANISLAPVPCLPLSTNLSSTRSFIVGIAYDVSLVIHARTSVSFGGGVATLIGAKRPSSPIVLDTAIDGTNCISLLRLGHTQILHDLMGYRAHSSFVKTIDASPPWPPLPSTDPVCYEWPVVAMPQPRALNSLPPDSAFTEVSVY